jgi:DNA-binding beta-propeller fold protein YncE
MKIRQLSTIGLLVFGAAMSAQIPVQSQDATDPIKSFDGVAKTDSFSAPWDATPDSEGKMIYFTATSHNGAGVFAVPEGGGAVKPLAIGTPFVMPLGIAMSTNNKTVYVADPWSAGADGNGIFAVPADGGKPTLLKGTQATMPRGIEVVSENGTDQIYFTGISLSDGLPAVLKIPVVGADNATVVAKGAPLSAPSGLAIAKDGTVYVLDRLAGGNGLGQVLRIKDDKIDKIADQIRSGGELAGLTLLLDESTLLVSELEEQKGTAQVLVIDLSTMKTSLITRVINENLAAGGLHRAHSVNIFAWAI